MTANDSDSDTYLSPAVCHQLSPAVVAAVVAAVIAAVIAALMSTPAGQCHNGMWCH